MNDSILLNETSGRRVMVVDDEPSIVDNIRFALEREGFEVITHGVGKSALEELNQIEIDLVILDVGLPDCNGFDVCREIRKSSNIPIIFLTSRTEEIDRIVGLELGADDYVLKPFSPRELSVRVKTILRRSVPNSNKLKQANEEQIDRGPFKIDENAMQISFKDQGLELTRYEYRLLEVLLQRPGWVFTRDQLMNKVWEAPDVSFERTVDTHIKTIRAKLREISKDEQPIRTHRGTGYSIQL